VGRPDTLSLRRWVSQLCDAFNAHLVASELCEASEERKIAALSRFLFAADANEALYEPPNLDARVSLNELLQGSLDAAVSGLGGLGLQMPSHARFHAPASSSLFSLFLTRRALPIVLVSLQVIVGRSAGLNLACAGVPGRFMARRMGDVPPLFLGQAGLSLTAQQVSSALGVPLEGAWLRQAATPRETVQRMLANVVRRPDGTLLGLHQAVPLWAAYMPLLEVDDQLRIRSLRLQSSKQDQAKLIGGTQGFFFTATGLFLQALTAARAALVEKDVRGEKSPLPLEVHTLEALYDRRAFV
jgi:hypothetical protein